MNEKPTAEAASGLNDLVRRVPKDRYHEVCTLREACLEQRIAALELFICEHGGLVNEWAKECPFGTKLTEHVKHELYRWLRTHGVA